VWLTALLLGHLLSSTALKWKLKTCNAPLCVVHLQTLR
jgi:hypothetical protein